MNSAIPSTALEELQSVLDSRSIIVEQDILETYGRDETSDLFGAPDMLIRAKSTEDVSAVMRICSRYRIPVTPRGAGTGVTGGSVPIRGGVVLSLEKLNHIIEIDTDNFVAVVEPGVITGELQKAVAKLELLYPPDPASLETCSIGGNVAQMAGGPRALKYGTTKDYVLGLECVLVDGSVIKTGGKIVKNATGYNLTGIITGSEGTLAIITKLYLKLIPAPMVVKDLLIPFNSLEKAILTVTHILKQRIVPATIEFMEKDAIRLVSRFLQHDAAFADAGAHLLIQLDGMTDDEVYEQMQKIASVSQIDPEDIYVADTSIQKERLWKTRRSIRESIQAISPVFFAEDCVVPRASIPDFLQNVKAFLTAKGLSSVMFGHAGDGNVHTNVLKGDLDYELWKKLLPELKEKIYRCAIELGGTISGEHGIGYVKKDYLHLAVTDAEFDLSKRIKTAFDPQSILNPEKLF